MKKFLFTFISLLICAGMVISCSSDSDELFDDSGAGVELTVGDGISLMKEIGPGSSDYDFADGEFVHDSISCYHSDEEWGKSKYSEYPAFKLPDIDWNKQTLVLIEHHETYQFLFNYCKVTKKGKKYIFDASYQMWLGAACCSMEILVIIDEPNVPIKNIKLNAVQKIE